MGLKGYRLWAMGQLDSNVQSPTASAVMRLIPVGRSMASYSRWRYSRSSHVRWM
jgi:hypothetical protein